MDLTKIVMIEDGFMRCKASVSMDEPDLSDYPASYICSSGSEYENGPMRQDTRC